MAQNATATPVQLSTNVDKLSTDTDTSAADVGPTAKRSRRTTSAQQKSKEGATPAAVLFADIRKRQEPKSPKGKQATGEVVMIPLNCELLTVHRLQSVNN